MYADMDTRSKLGVGFIAFVALVAVLMALDRLVIRPHEPIHVFTDKKTLEGELDGVIAATSTKGIWGEKQNLQRTRLVVEAIFSPRSSVQQSTDELIVLLKRNQWQNHESAPSKALASLCKGRYRANLWPMEEGRIALSLSVNRYQRDADCGANGGSH